MTVRRVYRALLASRSLSPHGVRHEVRSGTAPTQLARRHGSGRSARPGHPAPHRRRRGACPAMSASPPGCRPAADAPGGRAERLLALVTFRPATSERKSTLDPGPRTAPLDVRWVRMPVFVTTQGMRVQRDARKAACRLLRWPPERRPPGAGVHRPGPVHGTTGVQATDRGRGAGHHPATAGDENRRAGPRRVRAFDCLLRAGSARSAHAACPRHARWLVAAQDV